MKEIEIKEKWLYEAMNRAMEKRDSIKGALNALAESLNEANKITNDLWCEMEKLYKLDPKKRFEYYKKTHVIREVCTKDETTAWMKHYK